MISRRHLGLVAGAATLLSAAPLSAIFERWTWFFESLIAVALVAGVATLVRSLRGPLWAQVLAMAGTLLLVLTWMFPSGEELLAVIPTPDTFAHFGSLLGQAAEDTQGYAVPVPDRPALLFLTVLGVGWVAILVDVVTVALRRPALAGLPMLAIYSVPVAIYTESLQPLPFIIGAIGYLWLLAADNVDRVRRFGRRFTGDGRDVDEWEPSPLAAAGRRLAVVGVALAVLTPLAIPGMSASLLDRLGSGGDGGGSGTGGRQSAATVNLFAELSGRLNQSDTTEYVKVTTNEPRPFYMRFGVADQVTPAGFRSRGPTGRSVTRDLPDPQDRNTSGISFSRYNATVEITDKFDMPMVPVYAEPVNTRNLDSSWFYDQSMQIVYSNRSRSTKKNYQFEYVRSEFNPQALRTAKQLPAENPIQRDFGRVPEVQVVQELVADLVADTPTQYDRVLAIYEHFSKDNGFSYSQETKPGTSGVDIVNFLTNKTGFCEQYAAAMAWLVRAARIPARVAFGFTDGNNRNGNTRVLTNRNLHAWTEVYLDGFGWVPFDATPSDSISGPVRTDWAPNTDAPPAATPTATPSGAATAAPDGSPSAGPGQRPDPGDGGGIIPIAPNATNWPWWALGAVLLLLAVLAIPALRRESLRRRRRARTAVPGVVAPAIAEWGDGTASPGQARVIVTDVDAAVGARSDAHAAWDELIDTLIDFRVPVDPTETPRATAERLVAQSELAPDAADGARLIGRAEERARYARDPLAAAGLGTALQAVRRALAGRVGRRTRLLAALMPPSVLLRWRLAIIDRSTNAVLTASRWQQGMARLSPRRLLPGRAGGR